MYAPIIRNLPEELRFTMLELVETVEQNMRAELAVRREDFESLQGVVREVAEMQYRADQRLDRLETALADLAEAQGRTEQRVEELVEAQTRTEQRVEELTEAQKRSEQRLDRLEVALTKLAEAQARTEQRVEELAEAQARTEAALQVLIKRTDRIEIRLDDLVGSDLERRYRERASGYFGRVLRRARAVDLREIEDTLETRLTDDELDDLRLLDVIIHGRPKARPDLEEVWLAVEVSAVVDRNDVERAQRRASLLRKAGLPALPVAAGKNQTERARVSAADLGVVIVQNGTMENWDEVLGTVLALGV